MSVYAPMELILKMDFAKQQDAMGDRFGMDSLALVSKDSIGMALCVFYVLMDKLGIQEQEHVLVSLIIFGTEISVKRV